jgi:hypothetical protein
LGRGINLSFEINEGSGLFMEEVQSVESALARESAKIQMRVEKLSAFCALSLIVAAIALAWPSLNESSDNSSAKVGGLGLAVLVLAWGMFIQDLGMDESKSRTRVGSIAGITWLPLVLMGMRYSNGSTLEIGGGILIIITGLVLKREESQILIGGLEVLRFKSVMAIIGLVCAISVALMGGISQNIIYAQWALIILVLAMIIRGWINADENRELRKEFGKRLHLLEYRILELRTTGAAVDQAASLIMTANGEGYRDLGRGMSLLDNAEEEIERSLSLADDVSAIEEDALLHIVKAEGIAPIIKRPRKAYEMGEREVILGSLREGESLFRQAKSRACEVIRWWELAENAIEEGSKLLSGRDGAEMQNLRDLLQEAKEKLVAEKPQKAYEYATVIPIQLEGADVATDQAEERLIEAARQLKAAEGLDLIVLNSRLDQAEKSFAQGNYSLASGLADGILRELLSEREAMDDVRRALRQKKHLLARWKDRADKDIWQARFDDIESAVDELQWSHAATLLGRLSADLDSEGKASADALELLEYVQEEWKILRNQCEASSIGVGDEQRVSAEREVALALEAHQESLTEKTLGHLATADGLMEKLKRRV